jgi:putative transposase
MPFYEYRRLSEDERHALVAERLARGFPPHRPPHPDQGPDYYLLTAAIYEHAPIIDPAARRDQFQDELLAAFTQPALTICAWAILPTHYHLLIWLPSLTIVPSIFNLLHGRTSRQWNQEDGTVGRKVWYHYSDRAIRSEQHFYRAINYLHVNPVRHGYVSRSRDWPWTSLALYQTSVGMEQLEALWRRYPTGDFGNEWDEAA